MIFQLTPSRRATSVGNISATEVLVFQLTPSRRATTGLMPQKRHTAFQLTPSRRATLSRSSARCGNDFNSRPHGGRHGRDKILQTLRTFQLTPSRRATRITFEKTLRIAYFNSRPHGGRLDRNVCRCVYREISTHALTEGDCKFRQIFLLNRGYAYSISLYFLPHFISLLPQILSFQQKPFKFQVRIFLLFSVHLAFALQNQCVHHVKYRFCTNMFYFVFVLFTQIVKPQTIGLFIYDFF